MAAMKSLSLNFERSFRHGLHIQVFSPDLLLGFMARRSFSRGHVSGLAYPKVLHFMQCITCLIFVNLLYVYF
jgi:hypothetical protein